MFWTGEEVCAREFSPGHLERVGRQLRRKPLLWDNYPVNDGPLMSPFLHLRGFTGRPASIGAQIAGHAVNPALQPTLSLIPAITLARSYAQGEAYEYVRAFQDAARQVLGADLAAAAREAGETTATSARPSDEPRAAARAQLHRADTALNEFRARVRVELRTHVARGGALDAVTVDTFIAHLDAAAASLHAKIGG